MKYRTCKKCGWVHFAVTLEHALDELCRFHRYYNSLSKKQQRENYGSCPASIRDYAYCDRCGAHYRDFRASKKDDCPSGCTIGPIIYDPIKRPKRVKKGPK